MPVINTALNVTVGDWKARMHVTNTVTKIMVSGAKTEHTHSGLQSPAALQTLLDCLNARLAKVNTD